MYYIMPLLWQRLMAVTLLQLASDKIDRGQKSEELMFSYSKSFYGTELFTVVLLVYFFFVQNVSKMIFRTNQ